MVTVNTTVKRELTTPEEILDYLRDAAKNDKFKPGDAVTLNDRSGVSPSAMQGDIGIVVGQEFAGSPFTVVKSLTTNGGVVNMQVPTQNLELYTGTGA